MKTMLACLIFAVLMIVMMMGCAPKPAELFTGMKCRIKIEEPREPIEADVTILSCEGK